MLRIVGYAPSMVVSEKMLDDVMTKRKGDCAILVPVAPAGVRFKKVGASWLMEMPVDAVSSNYENFKNYCEACIEAQKYVLRNFKSEMMSPQKMIMKYKEYCKIYSSAVVPVSSTPQPKIDRSSEDAIAKILVEAIKSDNPKQVLACMPRSDDKAVQNLQEGFSLMLIEIYKFSKFAEKKFKDDPDFISQKKARIENTPKSKLMLKFSSDEKDFSSHMLRSLISLKKVKGKWYLKLPKELYKPDASCASEAQAVISDISVLSTVKACKEVRKELKDKKVTWRDCNSLLNAKQMESMRDMSRNKAVIDMEANPQPSK